MSGSTPEDPRTLRVAVPGAEAGDGGACLIAWPLAKMRDLVLTQEYRLACGQKWQATEDPLPADAAVPSWWKGAGAVLAGRGDTSLAAVADYINRMVAWQLGNILSAEEARESGRLN